MSSHSNPVPSPAPCSHPTISPAPCSQPAPSPAPTRGATLKQESTSTPLAAVIWALNKQFETSYQFLDNIDARVFQPWNFKMPVLLLSWSQILKNCLLKTKTTQSIAFLLTSLHFKVISLHCPPFLPFNYNFGDEDKSDGGEGGKGSGDKSSDKDEDEPNEPPSGSSNKPSSKLSITLKPLAAITAKKPQGSNQFHDPPVPCLSSELHTVPDILYSVTIAFMENTSAR